MRLKYQVFISLLIAGALLISIMFLISSLQFSRGFLRYINNADADRMQSIVTTLENQFERDGNWDNISSDPNTWNNLLRAGDSENIRRFNRRSTPKRHGGRKPPPPSPIERLQRRLILADAAKQPLIGTIKKNDNLTWKPINQNDNIVGYLGLRPLKRLDNQFDQAFERRQMKGFAIAGLSMILLSALMAAPLASRVVKPILSVKHTVSEISQGNYADRVNTTRRDEIGDLAKDVNTLGATLEKSQDNRRQMIAEISHELRTPVAVLRGEIEAIQDGLRDLNNDSLDSLHAETLKLNRLIDDLHTLSLAGVGALDYRMEPINLADAVAKQLSQHNKNTNLDIQLSTSAEALFINGDKQRIEQLIDNLMQNSIRYTDLPGSIKIKLSKTDHHIQLEWADSSPGVATEALDKLFDPLFREEKSRSREHGGAGLGLSIVNKIVQAHDSTCTADHSDSGGLKLTINFPALRNPVN